MTNFVEQNSNQSLLYIVILCQNMQYQPKLMIQTQERDQNPRILGTFGPILGPEFFFFLNQDWSLSLVYIWLS